MRFESVCLMRIAEYGMSTFRRYEPLRFLIIGAFNTSLCYLVYALLNWIGLPFWLANLGSLFFGIGLSFFTQGRLVFRNSDAKLFGRFFCTWLMIYVIQTAAIKLLINADISANVAGLIVLPGTAVASYVFQKHIVFRKSRHIA